MQVQELIASGNKLECTHEEHGKCVEQTTIAELVIEQGLTPPVALPRKINKLTDYNMKLGNPQITKFTEELLQRISEQEIEIEKCQSMVEILNDKYRQSMIACDELQIYKSQLKELQNNLLLSPNEKDLQIINQIDECRQFKIALNRENRKVEFLNEDYKTLHLLFGEFKKNHYQLMYSLKNQLIENTKSIANLEQYKKIAKDRVELLTQNQNLKDELILITSKTSNFCSNFLKTLSQLDPDNYAELNFKNLEKIAVINNNLTVDFICINELQTLKNDLNLLQTKNVKLEIHIKHLDELLNLSKQQLNDLQHLYYANSEAEINLQHLIVDMQCESNNNYIIAKLNRELRMC